MMTSLQRSTVKIWYGDTVGRNVILTGPNSTHGTCLILSQELRESRAGPRLTRVSRKSGSEIYTTQYNIYIFWTTTTTNRPKNSN